MVNSAEWVTEQRRHFEAAEVVPDSSTNAAARFTFQNVSKMNAMRLAAECGGGGEASAPHRRVRPHPLELAELAEDFDVDPVVDDFLVPGSPSDLFDTMQFSPQMLSPSAHHPASPAPASGTTGSQQFAFDLDDVVSHPQSGKDGGSGGVGALAPSEGSARRYAPSSASRTKAGRLSTYASESGVIQTRRHSLKRKTPQGAEVAASFGFEDAQGLFAGGTGTKRRPQLKRARSSPVLLATGSHPIAHGPPFQQHQEHQQNQQYSQQYSQQHYPMPQMYHPHQQFHQYAPYQHPLRQQLGHAVGATAAQPANGPGPAPSFMPRPVQVAQTFGAQAHSPVSTGSPVSLPAATPRKPVGKITSPSGARAAAPSGAQTRGIDDLLAAGATKIAGKRWTTRQDEQLRAAVEMHGASNWKAIADMVEGRNHVQCLQRWKKVLQPGLIKGMWSQEEDDVLVQLMHEQGEANNWTQISERIPGRTAKQCRERWHLNLDPSINRGPWTREEDNMLLNLHSQIGNKWAEIKRSLPGRTENGVKSRYKSVQRALRKIPRFAAMKAAQQRQHQVQIYNEAYATLCMQ